MSQENVELVRRSYQVLNHEGVQAALELHAHPAVEFDYSGVFPDGGAGRGRDAFVEAVSSYIGSFEQYRCEPTELIEVDPDRILAMVRDGGRMKGSDKEIYNDFVHLWTIRDGVVVEWSGFSDKADALEAAGLRE
jgi:ketosteroid isomerase-like protein